MDEIIELNVGGKYYSTTRMTLCRYDDTMLALIISGNFPTSRDSQNRIFIDRDGDLFGHVLNYLRTNKLLVELGLTELSSLRVEADFYRIETMVHDLDELIARERERRDKRVILQDEKLIHYQMQNSQNKYDTLANVGYHLDLIEHNFLSKSNKSLQIICHYDVFKLLPLVSADFEKLNGLRQTVATTQMTPQRSGNCWYLGNDCFEMLNIAYLTRTQIGHILLQCNAKLLNSNIAYLNSNNNNNAITLSMYDKWFIPKYIVDKHSNIFNTITTQNVLLPGRTMGFIDWNRNDNPENYFANPEI